MGPRRSRAPQPPRPRGAGERGEEEEAEAEEEEEELFDTLAGVSLSLILLSLFLLSLSLFLSFSLQCSLHCSLQCSPPLFPPSLQDSRSVVRPYLVVLRDPVTRFLSAFYYARRNYANLAFDRTQQYEAVWGEKPPLAAFLSPYDLLDALSEEDHALHERAMGALVRGMG